MYPWEKIQATRYTKGQADLEPTSVRRGQGVKAPEALHTAPCPLLPLCDTYIKGTNPKRLSGYNRLNVLRRVPNLMFHKITIKAKNDVDNPLGI